jgi:hypothetical protein
MVRVWIYNSFTHSEMKFRFVEVGPVEAENPPTPIPEPSGASASNQHHPVANISWIRRLWARSQNAPDLGWSVHSRSLLEYAPDHSVPLVSIGAAIADVEPALQARCVEHRY